MRYSAKGDAALQRVVEEIVAENKSLLQVEGVWPYGWPKVFILFATDDALRQAKKGGLLNRIESKVAEAVKHDPAFGRNRQRFNPQQAVCPLSDRQAFELTIKGWH